MTLIERGGGQQRRWRAYAWCIVAAAAGLLVSLMVAQAFASDASAHAALIRSNPDNNETLRNAPARVTLRFSEPLERKLTKIEVVDADDNRVDEGDTAFDEDDRAFASVGLQELEPGLYYVRWSNVSTVDGHPLQGTYPFVITNEDGSLPPGVDLSNTGGSTVSGTEALPKNIDSALKWIAMTALAAVAGAALFVLVIYRPAARFLEDEPYERVIEAGEHWLINIGHVLLPISFIATAFLVITAVSEFETGTSLWSYLTDVRSGQYRAALMVLLVVGLAGTDVLFLTSSKRGRQAGLLFLVVSSFAAIFTYSMISHSATDEGKFWSVTSDYIHFAASAAWLGALVMLPVVLRTQAAGDPERRFLFQANVFDRFSVLAGLSVIAIIATGIFNGLVEIPTWDALKDTTYGRVLLAKLALVVPVLAVAGLNAFILKPRLVAAVDEQYARPEDFPAAGAPAGGAGEDPRSTLAWLQRWLPRTILLEVLLVIAVFASVSVLTQTSTARGEIAQEEAQRTAEAAYSETVEIDGLNMTLESTPNLVGRNDYSVTVKTAGGEAAENITQVRLRFRYDTPGLVIPPSEIELNEFAPGEFRGESANFSEDGNWRVEVGLRRSDGDDISQTFVLTVAEPPARAETGGAFDLPFTSFTWNEVAGAFLALIGVMIVVYRHQLGWLPRRAVTGAMAAAAAMLIAGAVLAFGVDQHGTPNDARAGNPIEPTEDSVARGRMLYEQNCVVCHGVDGRGDGPAAADLNPRPSDYRQHIPFHTDVEVYNFIANGYPMSAMPAWADEFSQDDIWNLVNFLRANFSEAPTR